MDSSAYAKDPGCKPEDVSVGRTLRSSKCEGGCVASADSAEAIKDTTDISLWSFIIALLSGMAKKEIRPEEKPLKKTLNLVLLETCYGKENRR